jgi:hypothetical protein
VAWPCPCAGAAAAAAGGWPSTAVGDCGPDGSTADWGRVMWQGRHGLPRTPRNGLDVLCRCWVSFSQVSSAGVCGPTPTQARSPTHQSLACFALFHCMHAHCQISQCRRTVRACVVDGVGMHLRLGCRTVPARVVSCWVAGDATGLLLTRQRTTVCCGAVLCCVDKLYTVC